MYRGSALLGIATVFFVVNAIILMIGLVWLGYVYDRDMYAYIERAQIAGHSGDMLVYLEQAKNGMENLNATKGHTALVFKTPMNDLGLHYKTIEKQIERLENAETMDKNSTEYQVVLDDVRGVLREFPNIAEGLLWIRFGWFMLILILVNLIWAMVETVR